MKCTTGPKLSREQWASLVEDYVNNPDLSLGVLGRKYGIYESHVSYLLSKIWFYKMLTNRRTTITIQSSINDSQDLVVGTVNLKQTA